MAGNIILRQNGESAHDHYKRINELRLACVVELSKNRCIDCTNFEGSTCKAYGTVVPDDYIFEANACESYDNDQIPF